MHSLRKVCVQRSSAEWWDVRRLKVSTWPSICPIISQWDNPDTYIFPLQFLVFCVGFQDSRCLFDVNIVHGVRDKPLQYSSRLRLYPLWTVSGLPSTFVLFQGHFQQYISRIAGRLVVRRRHSPVAAGRARRRRPRCRRLHPSRNKRKGRLGCCHEATEQEPHQLWLGERCLLADLG